jgi:hypothetical protein
VQGAENQPIGRAQPLTADTRLQAAKSAYETAGCFYALVGIVLLAGVIAGATHWLSVPGAAGAGAFGIFVVLGGVFLVLWYRYRLIFFREALRVPGGLAKSQIPRSIDPAQNVVDGVAVVASRLRVRTLAGRAGSCQIELYDHGMQIWRGPRHAEPRWRFAYSEVALAEPVAIEQPKGPDAGYLRLVLKHPPMAFLCGPTRDLSRDVIPLLAKMREKGVEAFTNV